MSDGFYVAPFALDGEFQGVGFRSFAELSPRWLDAALHFLESNGHAFRASWGEQLAAIETRLTYSQGVGLCTFYAEQEVVTSHLLQTGVNLEVEASVSSMFVQSLLRVDRVRLVARSNPSAEALALIQRPLDVVVFWAPESIPPHLLTLTQELSLHFVGAFFRRLAQLQ